MLTRGGTGLVSLDVLLALEGDGKVPVYAGGTCGNVLSILSYFGWNSFPCARIGNDSVAKALLADLRQCGVREDFLVVDEKAATPLIVQRNRRQANGDIRHAFVWQCPNCGTFLPMFRPPVRLAAAQMLERLPRQDVFFFDRVAPAAVALAEASAKRKALVVFEPQRQASDNKAFVRALRSADVVKYSFERIRKLARPRGWRPRLEIQTLGSAGLRYRLESDRRWSVMEAIAAESDVRDTSGAGDWTTAGILEMFVAEGLGFAASKRMQIERSIRFGQAMAAINCGYEGARGAMYALSAQEIRDRAQRLLRGKHTAIKATSSSSLTRSQFDSAYCSACWP